MAEIWRYADRMAAAQASVKRTQSEFDNSNLAGAGYFSREEPRFDEQNRGVVYGSGLTGADLSGLTSGHIGLNGLGATNLGLPIHADNNLLGHSGGHILGFDSAIGKSSTLGLNNGRSDSLARQDSQGPPMPVVPLSLIATSTLFVEGLPKDCARREAAHVFRPFYGFKEVRLARKKRSGNVVIFCFVDFTDAQRAATALEALQGYKFDQASEDSEPLRLQFCHTPGLQSGRHLWGRRHRRRSRR